ncbi:MAG: InlB B-repeat-containing protein [Spirochaetia bacterium]|nr:InlB B-repeat-containing protein [Spirochaetia bacterium]
MKNFSIAGFIVLACFFIFISCGGGGGGSAVEDNAFTVDYNANGAESGSAPAAQNGTDKKVLEVSANTGNLAKSGYLFDGWNTQPDGYGIDYAPGAEYKGKTVTLYAKWTAIFNYNVINPGSPSPALDSVQHAPGNPTATITGLTNKGRQLSDITIPRTIDGFTISAIGDNAFMGCTNLSNILIPDTVTDIGDNAFNGCLSLSGITMQGTVPPTLGTDVFTGCVLLAVSVPQSAVSAYNSSPTWSTVAILAPGTFSIIYNDNGSDGGIVPARQVGMIGININIYGNNGSLTRAGCTFNGWNTKADGTGLSFAPNATYSGPDNMTLYAQWTHPDYIVTFDSQGAETQASPSTIIVKAPANTISSLPVAPSHEGHYFAGWYTEPDGLGEPFIVGSYVFSNKTVYAYWSTNSYTVRYDGNGATRGSVPDQQEALFNQSITLRTNTGNLGITGYEFVGWNTKADGSGEDYSAGATYSVTKDIIMYAKWTHSFSVNINATLNGNVIADKTSNITAGETVTLTISPASGYKLDSINVFDSNSNEVVLSGSKNIRTFSMPTCSVTISAIFSQLQFTSLAELEVGDIVFASGRYAKQDAFILNQQDYMSISAPVGVVAYIGTANYGEVDKVYMMGLKQVNKSISTSFIDYNLNTTENDGYTNTYRFENNINSYPAFNYAINYASDAEGDANTAINYSTGWFVPSKNELWQIWNNRSVINTAINAINSVIENTGTELLSEGKNIWTSSSYFSQGLEIRFYSLAELDNRMAISEIHQSLGGAAVNHKVRVVRALN